ncbi:MAG TPA: archaellin/type IV pilin N-terminal domain-containing protein [Candidatus Nanoarchaeia archaeon]|nr:archaellin/type IV pilin N-terminal domain-containing protein [Candidatus Nanoarchaeia archaeon]
MKRNKRGVSPLIAAVLLVAFAVAMAAFVSSFVIKKTKEFKPESFIQDSALCDGVTLAYEVMKNPSEVPPNDLKISYGRTSDQNVYTIYGLRLKNKGAFTIYKLTINSPGQQSQDYDITKVASISKPDGLKPGESIPDSSETDPESGSVIKFPFKVDKKNKNIKIIPWIQDPEKDLGDPEKNIICTKRALYIDPIGLCIQTVSDHAPGSCRGVPFQEPWG